MDGGSKISAVIYLGTFLIGGFCFAEGKKREKSQQSATGRSSGSTSWKLKRLEQDITELGLNMGRKFCLYKKKTRNGIESEVGGLNSGSGDNP
jgi:hypothetical protein